MSTEKGAFAEVGPKGSVDDSYNLVGVLYHATHHGADYETYIADAEKDADEDLAQFFRDLRDENERRVMRAKQLLRKRL